MGTCSGPRLLLRTCICATAPSGGSVRPIFLIKELKLGKYKVPWADVYLTLPPLTWIWLTPLVILVTQIHSCLCLLEIAPEAKPPPLAAGLLQCWTFSGTACPLLLATPFPYSRPRTLMSALSFNTFQRLLFVLKMPASSLWAAEPTIWPPSSSELIPCS